MRPIANKLTREERGELLEAIFQYADEKTVPELSHAVDLIFEIFKRAIDTNERKYLEKCERNRLYREQQKAKQEADKPPEQPETEVKPTARGKPAREPTSQKTATSKASGGDLAKLRERFLTAFKTYLPDKEINCKLSDFPDVDLEALMFAIRESPQFLMNPQKNKAFKGLRWYLENAEKIIAGAYVKFENAEKPKAKQNKTNVYTDEQMKEIYGNIPVFGEEKT